VAKLFQYTLILVLNLTVVLLGFSPEAFHSHEEDVHCADDHGIDSADACHLALYHHVGLKSCEDHAHWVDFESGCALCFLMVAKYNLFRSDVQMLSIVKVDRSDPASLLEAPYVHRFVIWGCLRGPPSMDTRQFAVQFTA
jgi:hypothetical protein